MLVEYTTCTPPLAVSSMCACAFRLIRMWSASLHHMHRVTRHGCGHLWLFLSCVRVHSGSAWHDLHDSSAGGIHHAHRAVHQRACFFLVNVMVQPQLDCITAVLVEYAQCTGWLTKRRSQLWSFYSCVHSGAARRDLHHSGAGGVHHSHRAAYQRRGHFVAEGEAARQRAQAPCAHLCAQVTVPPPLQAQHTHHHDRPRHRPCSFSWLHPGAGPPAPGR